MYSNPILQSLRNNASSPQQNPQLAQLRQMVQMYKTSQNPNYIIQNMMSQNPNLKQAMDYVSRNGGNPQQAFYALANQMGINPQTVLSQLGL